VTTKLKSAAGVGTRVSVGVRVGVRVRVKVGSTVAVAECVLLGEDVGGCTDGGLGVQAARNMSRPPIMRRYRFIILQS